MKAYLFLIALLTAVSSRSSAQQIELQSIQDSVIGWMKVYRFTGVRSATAIDAKRYSPAQLSIMDSLANWIQASYTPRGALGDVIRAVSPKLGLYNKDDAALPQTYGAYAKTYTELKRDANGELVPFTDSHLTWSIRANAVFGEPLLMLNTPAQYYFLLPNLGSNATAVKPDAARYDLSRVTRLSIATSRISTISSRARRPTRHMWCWPGITSCPSSASRKRSISTSLLARLKKDTRPIRPLR